MAKKSLTAGEVTVLFQAKRGTWNHPAQLEFRIDPDATETASIRYATGSEAADEASSDDWMPLLLNEIKNDAQLVEGKVYKVVSDADVDVYYSSNQPSAQ